MGMRIEKSFVVAAPADAVWAFLIDPRRVASCLPGAAVTDEIDPQTFAGTMNVKVGPVTASYRGKMRFERLDAVAREADIAASGQETRGKGAADMRMSSRVVARGPAETEVVIVSDVNVIGVLAQFGKGMIEDVSDQMFGKFSAAMRKQLESDAAAAAAEAAGPGVAVPNPAGALSPASATHVGAGPASAPEAKSPAAAGGMPASAPPLAPPASPARHPEKVLDLGAIGAAAASRAAGRVLRNPVWWVAAALALHLLWHLLR